MSARSLRFIDSLADYRTLLWSLVLFPLPLALAYLNPSIAGWLVMPSLYLAFCSGVLSHYHNHRGVFRSAKVNRIYSVWLSAFYGFPLWAWIPTHNQNHHKYNNGPGDVTRITSTHATDSVAALLSYPSRSASSQLALLRQTWSQWRAKDSKMFKYALLQTVAVPMVHVCLLLAFSLRSGTTGTVAYLLCGALPAAFAPWSMMLINYIQHVGCDFSSPHNHSRNFVSPFCNWFIFDAGYHTVHHEAPGRHWSTYRGQHAARASLIEPSLNQHNVFSFLWNCYVRRDRSVVRSVCPCAEDLITR